MKTRIPNWYYIIPVLYIALIAGFIHLYLNESGGRTLSRELGPVTVRYRQESGVRRGISRLTVEADGLTMDLSEGVPVQDAAGRNDRVPVSAVTREGDRLVLRLSRGGSIEFATGFSLGGGISAPGKSEPSEESGVEDSVAESQGGQTGQSGQTEQVEQPGQSGQTGQSSQAGRSGQSGQGGQTGQSSQAGRSGQSGQGSGFAVVYRSEGEKPADFFPVLTFTPVQGAELTGVYEGLPLMQMSSKDGLFLVVQDQGKLSEEGDLVLRFDGTARPAFFEEVKMVFSTGVANGVTETEKVFPGMVMAEVPEEAGEDLVTYWFFGDQQAGPAEKLEDLVNEKIGRMAEFWRQGGETGEEKLVGALAAYSMEQRGEPGLDAVAGMRTAAREAGQFTTAPFVGNIVVAEQSYSDGLEKVILGPTDKTDREGLVAMFAESAESTSYPSLVGGLVFAGEDEKLQQLAEMGGKLIDTGLDNSIACAGIFIFSMEILNSHSDWFGDAAALAGKAYRSLLPNIVKIGTQLMYRAYAGEESGDEDTFSADLILQIKLARALQSYGLSEEEGLARQLGDMLLESVLALMDGNGVLPGKVSLEGGELKEAGEKIAPELFYPYLTGTNFYPRVVSLKKELNRDLRVWTAARGVGAVQRADGYEITFDFAAGQTEFLVIRGVEPFTSLDLYGLKWNGDFRFQNYDVGGWYYDREQKKLYMKIRHNDRVERIRIFE